MVYRLHVARDQRSFRCSLVNGQHVFLSHDDRRETGEDRFAGVEHDDFRMMPGDGGCHMLVPDRVAGKVQPLVRRVAEDHPSDLPQRRNGFQCGICSVLPASLRKVDSLELGVLREGADILKTLAPDMSRILIVLGKER